MIGYGIDLSHHQDPAAVPWERLRGKVNFVFVRAAYGAALQDEKFEEHIARARAIGAKVGAYLFFRPSQSEESQWSVLKYLAQGDIVPAIDIEDDTSPKYTPVAPSWSEPCRQLVQHVVDTFGDALVYTTQSAWTKMGKPSWMLERRLWVAHYTPAATPASPGNVAPTIWQHLVGAFDPKAPGGDRRKEAGGQLVLDQNRLLKPLPLIGSAITDADRARVGEQIALSLSGLSATSLADLSKQSIEETEPETLA